MAKKEPVNVNWQSLFAIIQIVNIWAFYRIEKLRRYFLFMVAYAAAYILIGVLLFGVDPFLDQRIEEGGYIFEGVFTALEIGISVGLIRMWSKKWNEQFVKPTNSE